jgi:hypothetical protein
VTELTTGKPLHPITHGTILIVGAKASNFDNDIRENPRVIMWESTHQHWTQKDLPANTRCVFFTRWLGHDNFHRIMKQVRKRGITVFNPDGTGMIAKQVRELLAVNGHHEEVKEKEPEMITHAVSAPAPMTILHSEKTKGKLTVLQQFIDLKKTNIENAHVLLEKGKELGITSTVASLANMVGTVRRGGGVKEKKKEQTFPKYENDAAVDILDNIIKELGDVRKYLVSTTHENKTLRARLDKFKKFLED